MNHKEIIEKLNKLDLSTYPEDEIKTLLKQLGEHGVIVTTLHPGKRILRARINKEPGEFDKISKLSYKPQEYNKTYMRASTPGKTMFYGSIVPEILGTSEPGTARITTIYEISDFVRNTETIGEQTITFSVWEVQKDINLISLMHYRKFQRPTELSENLQKEFTEFIKRHPEKELPSIEIAEFLGEQFAKEVKPENDYDYQISAIYSEIVTELGNDGVLYPSVKLAGEGINVAITVESVKTKLKLVHAGECTIYKNGKQVFVGNDTHAIIKEDESLSYELAPKDIFVSKDFGRKQVGI